jgi:hypothetical protein
MTSVASQPRASFDELLELAKLEPDDFERVRSSLLESCIGRSSNQERLRRLQWRIDAERNRSNNPLDATVRISQLMWKKFDEFNSSLNKYLGCQMIGTTGRTPIYCNEVQRKATLSLVVDNNANSSPHRARS